MSMFEAFAIGIKLEIQGNITAQMEKLNKQISAATEKFSKLTNVLKRLNTELGSTESLVKSIATAMASMGDGLSGGLGQATQAAAMLNKTLAQTTTLGAAATEAVAMASVGAGVAAAGTARRATSGYDPMALGAGLAGRRYAPKAEGSGGHGVGHHAMNHLRAHMGMGRMGITDYVGGVGMMSALAGGFVAYKGFENYGRFQQAQYQLASQGFGAAENSASVSMAMNSSIPGVSPIDMMTAINMGSAVTRSPEDGRILAPWLAKMKFANQTIFPMEGRSFTDMDEQRVLRASELMANSTGANGHIDVKRVVRALNLSEKMLSTEGGAVSPNDLFNFAKQAAAVVPGMTPEALFEMVPLMQAMTGMKAGTALTTTISQFTRGQNFRTGKRSIALLNKMGIFHGMRAVDQNLLHSNFEDWFQQVYLTQLAKHGVTTEAGISQFAFQTTTSNIARLLVQSYIERGKVNASRGLFAQAYGIDQNNQVALGMNPGKLTVFEKAWEGFTVAFGKLASPAIIGALEALTHFFQGVTYMLNLQGAIFSSAGSFLSKEWSDFRHPTSSVPQVHVHVDKKGMVHTFVDEMSQGLNSGAPASGSSVTPAMGLWPTQLNYPGGF